MKPSIAADALTMEVNSDTLRSDGSDENNLDFSLSPTITPSGVGSGSSDAGNRIGKYIVRSHLGAGGMGSVYLAFDPMIEREIALKILSSEQSGSDIAVQRFLQEARAIGKLKHPNVVAIYDIDRWENQYFIVMELISGGSLGQKVRRDGPLDWREACRLIMEAAEGLNAAHEAQLIHRDVKPENLMVTSDGQCKVVDFGLCKASALEADIENAITRVNNILGTPQYMSPEQFDGGELDGRSDVYSLGGTLFYLLTGKYPFHEAQGLLQMMTAHAKKQVESVRQWNPQIPEECDRIIAKAMAKSRDDRFATAGCMATALRELLDKGEAQRSFFWPADSVQPKPLRDVLVIEPSKMQATVLSSSFKKWGIPSVRIASSYQEAIQRLDEAQPDALITSLLYNDGTGLELIRRIRHNQDMSLASVILNSSDSSMEDLVAASPFGHAVLSPKKTRPDDLLRMIHGTGFFYCEALSASLLRSSAKPRLVVLTETGELSEQLAKSIRELEILDVIVDSLASAGTLRTHSGPELRLIVRHGADADASLLAKLAQQFSIDESFTVIVQDVEDHLRLKAACFRGMLALADSKLGSERLRLLLESCGS